MIGKVISERKASQQSVLHDHRDKYALNAGDSAPSQAVFYASAFFPLERGSPVRPSASNANRWAEYVL